MQPKRNPFNSRGFVIPVNRHRNITLEYDMDLDIDTLIKETVQESLDTISQNQSNDDEEFPSVPVVDTTPTEVPVISRQPVTATETPLEVTELQGLGINIILVQAPEDSEPEFLNGTYLNNPFHRFRPESGSDLPAAYGYFQTVIKPALTSLENLFSRIGNITVLGSKAETTEKFSAIAGAVVANISKFFPEVSRISFDPTIDTATTSVVNETTFHLGVCYKADSETFSDIRFVDKLAKLTEKMKVKVRVTFAIPLDKVTPNSISHFEGYETSYSYQTDRLPSLKRQRLAILGELNKGEVRPHIIFSKLL